MIHGSWCALSVDNFFCYDSTCCKRVIASPFTVESSLVLQTFDVVGDQLIGVSNGNQLVYYNDIDHQVSVCMRACMCVDLCGLCECMRGCVVETANRKEEAIQLFH